MTIICKNCNQHFKGNYCNHCGQPAETHKLDFHYLVHEIQHGLFHFDKGLLYTIKALFTRPGNSIREFISGKRIMHFKPLSYLIVLATLNGFLYHLFIKAAPTIIKITGNSNEIIDFVNANEWMISHYSIFNLLCLPLFALCSFLAFKKSHYSYVENLILNAFLSGQQILLKLLFFPLVLLFEIDGKSALFTNIPQFLGMILNFWTFNQFFNNVKFRFWRTVLYYIFILVIIFLILTISFNTIKYFR